MLAAAAPCRDHIDSFRRLAGLYATVRNAYADRAAFGVDLAYKTSRLVRESAVVYGLGDVIRTATFDVETLEGMRKEDGSDEAKVFNLVRGLREEADAREDAPVLDGLKDRAERILEDLQHRNVTALQALDLLEALAKEKAEAVRAEEGSGLSSRAFGVYWALRNDGPLRYADISALVVAREADALLARFPNAAVNPDERRKLRGGLYHPVLGLESEERTRVVDTVLAVLLGDGRDADG